VLAKLKMLIRNEMNNIGGQELSLSAIGRKNTWEISGMKLHYFIFTSFSLL
jgi:prolyl-tRNA synthetase